MIIINESKENPRLKIWEESRDVHSGEMFMALYAEDLDEGIIVGYVDFSIYNDEAFIKMVEVHKDWQRKGIGIAMMDWMIEEYKWENIKWTMTTPEGNELARSIERKYGKRIRYN